jgi:hypothetical protein
LNGISQSSNGIGVTGGAGISSAISGSVVAYSGGGGGCGYTTSATYTYGPGGGGGGGSGGAPPVNGLANTGGGGGGSGSTSGSVGGGTGGSGIVIIRYPSYLASATSTTGSPQTYIAGAWRVYVFTASGTITF